MRSRPLKGVVTVITETSPPRSRRALLSAALGAGVATLAAALGRPLSAKAADGQPVLVGGEYDGSSVTKITVTSPAVALWGKSTEESGVVGESFELPGVRGHSGVSSGVDGRGSVGVRGGSPGGSGVFGVSGSEWDKPFPWARLTGVYGYAAHDVSARGVHGHSTVGRGVFGQATTGQAVHGYATTGTAGYFATELPTSGFALRAIGRVKLDKCVGIATVASGTKSIVVSPGIDLGTGSAVVATLQGTAGGTTTVHRVAVDTAANSFTIYLTANSTSNVKVAWHVFG